MKKALVVSIFLNAALVLVACGAPPIGGNNPPSGPPPMHAYLGGVPGFHGMAARTTARDFSIVPRAYADTGSGVTFTGSYSGFCPALATPAGSASVLYGSGTTNIQDCANTWFIGNPDNGQTAAANAGGAQLVIGDGTLGPLVAWASSSTATVHVYVNRAGRIVDTGISCALTGARCTSQATFPVLDGDTIAAVAVSDGSPSSNLQFTLAKQ